MNGVRYRETLRTAEEPFGTTDRRKALELEKERVTEIHQGKGTSPFGKGFGRKPFGTASDIFPPGAQGTRLRAHSSTRAEPPQPATEGVRGEATRSDQCERHSCVPALPPRDWHLRANAEHGNWRSPPVDEAGKGVEQGCRRRQTGQRKQSNRWKGVDGRTKEAPV